MCDGGFDVHTDKEGKTITTRKKDVLAAARKVAEGMRDWHKGDHASDGPCRYCEQVRILDAYDAERAERKAKRETLREKDWPARGVLKETSYGPAFVVAPKPRIEPGHLWDVYRNATEWVEWAHVSDLERERWIAVADYVEARR